MSEENEALGIHAEPNPDLDLEPWEREVIGMQRAIILVQQKADDESLSGFNGDDVLAIHKYVLNDPLNPHFSGRLRKVLVKMGGFVRGEYREAAFIPIHPDELPEKFQNFSQELTVKTSAINKESSVGLVIETAAWAHIELIRMHPFKDGNGRTARLLADYIFKRAGLPYLTDWGVLNDEYKDIVDRSYKENKPDLFKKFLAEKLIERTGDVTSMNKFLRKDMDGIRQETEIYKRSL